MKNIQKIMYLLPLLASLAFGACNIQVPTGPNGGNCGNGTIDAGEQCDNGAQNGQGMGCDMNCMTTGAGSYCGDGFLNGTEQCDLGTQNGTAGSTCSSTCNTVASGAVCGDGLLNGTEQCDLGTQNGTAGSTCSSTCTTVASGAVCGDGIVNGTEQCDLGLQNGGAGSACSATCTIVAAPPATGFSSVTASPATVTAGGSVTVTVVAPANQSVSFTDLSGNLMTTTETPAGSGIYIGTITTNANSMNGTYSIYFLCVSNTITGTGPCYYDAGMGVYVDNMTFANTTVTVPSFTVTGGQAPYLTSVTATPATVAAGGSVTVTVVTNPGQAVGIQDSNWNWITLTEGTPGSYTGTIIASGSGTFTISDIFVGLLWYTNNAGVYVNGSTLVSTGVLVPSYTVTVAAGAFCGDGIVNGTEQCDLGAQNGGADSACSSTCTIVAAPPATGFSSVTASPATVTAGGSVTVTVVAPASQTVDLYDSANNWIPTIETPAGSGIYIGTVTTTANSINGTYNVNSVSIMNPLTFATAWYYDGGMGVYLDGSTWLNTTIAVASYTVTGGLTPYLTSVTASPATVAIGGSVTVTVVTNPAQMVGVCDSTWMCYTLVEGIPGTYTATTTASGSGTVTLSDVYVGAISYTNNGAGVYVNGSTWVSTGVVVPSYTVTWTVPTTVATLTVGNPAMTVVTVTSDAGVWVAVPVTAGLTYTVLGDDGYQGSGLYTLDARYIGYDAVGTQLFNYDSSFTSVPSATAVFTAAATGTVYINIQPWSLFWTGTAALRVY